MTSDSDKKDWSKDPSLSGIDLERLQALQEMAAQSRGKSQAEMMPFLLSLMQGQGQNAMYKRQILYLGSRSDHLRNQSRKIETGSRTDRSTRAFVSVCIAGKTAVIQQTQASPVIVKSCPDSDQNRTAFLCIIVTMF